MGLSPDSVEIVTELDESWSGAGHRVRAFVGWLEAPPRLETFESEEVTRVWVVDVEPLLDRAAARQRRHQHLGEWYEHFEFTGPWGQLWGLSADLLVELFGHLRGEPSDRAAVRRDDLRRYLGSDPERFAR